MKNHFRILLLVVLFSVLFTNVFSPAIAAPPNCWTKYLECLVIYTIILPGGSYAEMVCATGYAYCLQYFV